MTPDDPRHGKRSGYLAGCHDNCCREPHMAYQAGRHETTRDRDLRVHKEGRVRRERLQALGVTTFIYPAEPVREHTQKLADLGWSSPAIAAMHGSISDTSIALLLKGVTTTVESKTALLLNLPYSLNVPDSVPGTALVPSLGVARRQQALLALGWTHAAIRAAMKDLCGHSVPRCEGAQVLARKWRVYDIVYQALHMKPGPSARTRDRARKLGYAPPLAWDDDAIDDPAAKPVGLTGRYIVGDYIDEAAVLRRMAGDRVTLTKDERIEVVRRLRASQWTFQQIEEHTGLNVDRYIAREKAAA